MFGHLDLLFGSREQLRYHQCSLCESLRQHYGFFGRLFTNYDMALCGSIVLETTGRPLPVTKKPCPMALRNPVMRLPYGLGGFLASMSVLLAAEKVKDDRYDEKRHYPAFVERWITAKREQAIQNLAGSGFDPALVEQSFQIQRDMEKTGGTLSDLAEPTGRVMAAVYTRAGSVCELGDHGRILGDIGRSLGRIIYVIDSLVDFQSDTRNGLFNPLRGCQPPVPAEPRPRIPEASLTEAGDILMAGIDAVEAAFEQLPLAPLFKEQIVRGLNQKVHESLASAHHECPDPVPSRIRWLNLMSYRAATLPLISMPSFAFASNGKDNGGGCYGSLFFCMIMAVLYMFICRGCCGRTCRQGPDQVTVDEGCGGRRTYRRDPCTGRYRNDRCC